MLCFSRAKGIIRFAVYYRARGTTGNVSPQHSWIKTLDVK